MPKTPQPSSSLHEKMSLSEFIRQNDKLLTAMGVMGGLAAFFSTVKEGQYLAFLSFAMLLILNLEVFVNFYKNKPWGFTLIAFEGVLELFTGAVLRFMVITYPTYAQQAAIPTVIIIIAFSLIFVISKKSRK